MTKLFATLLLLAGLWVADHSHAQPVAGGPCAAASGASGADTACPRGGPRGGMRGGMGPGARWGQGYTPGWAMMSRDEQAQHRDKMRSFTDYDQCRVYMEQHHGQMTERAKERGRAMPQAPRRDACAGLKPPAAKK